MYSMKDESWSSLVYPIIAIKEGENVRIRFSVIGFSDVVLVNETLENVVNWCNYDIEKLLTALVKNGLPINYLHKAITAK